MNAPSVHTRNVHLNMHTHVRTCAGHDMKAGRFVSLASGL